MSGSNIAVLLPLIALYVLFLIWYGGRGKPLAPDEIERFLAPLRERARDEHGLALLADVQKCVTNDDGREFVMQNLIRYRAKALYPPGYDFGESAPAADRRYGRAILPHLLRYGCVPVLIARRSGSFIDPPELDRWDLVAMVRYRSRRDFLRFVTAIAGAEITMHKWAAIERTQVFPVTPVSSLIFVRGLVGVLLAAVGLLLA